MNEEQILKLFDELGNRLTPTASHVFELAVRQQIIMGIFLGFITVIILMTTVFSAIYAFKYSGNKKPNTLGILFFGGLISVFSSISPLTLLLNPEYAALKDLIEQIRP